MMMMRFAAAVSSLVWAQNNNTGLRATNEYNKLERLQSARTRMQQPKLITDTYGFTSDFEHRPFHATPLHVLVDARQRTPSPSTSPASFEVELASTLQSVIGIELRDGMVALPPNYDQPYVLLFLYLNNKRIGKLHMPGPVKDRGGAAVSHTDSELGAFTAIAVDQPNGTPECYVARFNRRILLRLPIPLAKVSKIGVQLTDYECNPLALFDEKSEPQVLGRTDRVWLEFEVLASNH
jgi:hypothetical protein